MCKFHIKVGIYSHSWPQDQAGLLLTPSPVIPLGFQRAFLWLMQEAPKSSFLCDYEDNNNNNICRQNKQIRHSWRKPGAILQSTFFPLSFKQPKVKYFYKIQDKLFFTAMLETCI